MSVLQKDYVKQVTDAKDLENKTLRATKAWQNSYGWIYNDKLRLQAACQGVKQELREAVRATGEPSFAEPLVRFLFNNVDDCAGLGNKNQGEMNQCNQEKMDYCADVGGEFQGEIDQTNTQEGDKRNERPPYAKTENGEYGRLGYRPLEEGGSVIRRISYSNQRKIGLNQN